MRLVVMSCWRYTKTKGAIEDFLSRGGFIGQMHDDWRTPVLEGHNRSDEVKAWLARHPDVDTFVCVADENKKSYPKDMPFVQTKTNDGIAYEHFKKMSFYLFGKRNAWTEFNMAQRAMVQQKAAMPGEVCPLAERRQLGRAAGVYPPSHLGND